MSTLHKNIASALLLVSALGLGAFLLTFFEPATPAA